MGIVFLREGRVLVLEAVQPVKYTPLDAWIARGDGGHYVVKRLENADEVLDQTTLGKMRRVGESMMGRDYDLYFEWSDERIYCSELVWKVYSRGAGVHVGERETLADFDLTHPVVQAKVRERFKGDPPAREIVISPAAIFASSLLVTVYEN